MTGPIERPSGGLVRPGLLDRLKAADRTWVGVGLATLAALVLWFIRLRSLPLFIDEGASWWVASQETLGSFWHVLLNQEVAPPPFYFGLRVLVHWIGIDGHIAMRLPVVVLTLPTVPLVAVLARQLGARRAGTITAAWLAALSPLLLEYAQEVRAYGPAMTLAVLGAVLLFRAEDRGWRRGDAIAAGVAIGLAPWIHYAAALPLVALLVLRARSVLLPPRPALLVPVVVGWVTSGVIAALQLHRVGPGLDAFTDLGGVDLQRVLATSWDGRYSGGSAIYWVALLGLVLAAAVAITVRGRGRAVAIAGLAGPVAIIVISALGPDIVNTRYLTAAAPFILAAVAVAADRFRPAYAAVALLLVFGATGVARSLDLSTGSYPNGEAVLEGVVPYMRPGDVVASQDIGVANWLPSYVAERHGISDVTTAWGTEKTGIAACRRRPILQLVPGALDGPTAAATWRPLGYAATVRLLPVPGWTLVIARPDGPAPAICDTVDQP